MDLLVTVLICTLLTATDCKTVVVSSSTCYWWSHGLATERSQVRWSPDR